MWTVAVKVSVGWWEGVESWCAGRSGCIVMGVGEKVVVVVVVGSGWRRCGCCALALKEMECSFDGNTRRSDETDSRMCHPNVNVVK